MLNTAAPASSPDAVSTTFKTYSVGFSLSDSSFMVVCHLSLDVRLLFRSLMTCGRYELYGVVGESMRRRSTFDRSSFQCTASSFKDIFETFSRCVDRGR